MFMHIFVAVVINISLGSFLIYSNVFRLNWASSAHHDGALSFVLFVHVREQDYENYLTYDAKVDLIYYVFNDYEAVSGSFYIPLYWQLSATLISTLFFE